MLEVKNLTTEFSTEQGPVCAVDQVSFTLAKGKSLGIVGESGCGKSVTALSILRLIQAPGRITSGEIRFHHQDLLKLPLPTLQKIRGSQIGLIFQEPMSSLNPVFTIGAQIEAVLKWHEPHLSASEAKQKTLQMLKLVNLPSPDLRYHEFPHQLSGGMQQRVLIAMALCCNPEILIADEPTTALDVTIQAQILELLQKLKKEMQLSLILITHDLAVVSQMCENVLVMYAGQIVESGTISDIFDRPRHPYTKGLANATLSLGTSERLKTIAGVVPSLRNRPSGCRFQDRCPRRQDKCAKEIPVLTEASSSQKVACHFPLSEGEDI